MRHYIVGSFFLALFCTSANPAVAQKRTELVKILKHPVGKGIAGLKNVGPFSIREGIELICAMHKINSKVIFFDEESFQQKYGRAGSRIRIQRIQTLRGVRIVTALQHLLNQSGFAATFRVEDNKIIFFAGQPPYPKDLSRFSPLTKKLRRTITIQESIKNNKMSGVVDLLSKHDKFSILLAERLFKEIDPTQKNVTERVVSIPKGKFQLWKVIQHVARQIDGIPLVQMDHVIIVPKKKNLVPAP